MLAFFESPGACTSPGCQNSERQREREFYRYYEPIRALSEEELPFVDLYDEEASKKHVPRPSSDNTLNALCQLGALRLNARRGMCFFFDRNHAYILAEATRTISSVGDTVRKGFDNADSLWLGSTMIPRGLAVCEHAINVQAETHDSDGRIRPRQGTHDILIVDDLSNSATFCDRPFVEHGPKARFYAGVPVTTPAGTRIGVYCVIDDKPRDGLSESEIAFMSEMSSTVMAHLELVQAKTDFSRQSRMLQGLGTFVKDKKRFPGLATESPRRAVPQTKSRDPSPGNQQTRRAPHNYGNAKSLLSSQLGHSHGGHDVQSESEKESADRRTVDQAQKRLDQQMSRTSGAGTRQMLQRASDVLRTALDADGVVVLDASSQTINVPSGGTGMSTDTTTDTAGTTDDNVGSDDSNQRDKRTNCHVLGMSRSSDATARHADMPVPEKFLKTLLQRYPQGKLWILNSDGEVSSAEEGHSDAPASSECQLHPKGTKSGEATEIRRLFPAARAVCFISMWDPIRERWQAGTLMWTYSPLRVFSSNGEVAYAMAFCDVVMARIARREAKLTDQAKSDFISSVSHELRSPLHGIIGSLELLQERETIDHTLLGQIEKCTTVLTDVVEHLLDYAKIDHHVSRARTSRRYRDKGERKLSQSSSMGLSAGEAALSLAKLTEDVADTSFYSHCCAVGPTASNKVDFVLDISAKCDFSIDEASGAWKRICGNLVGNALKFTELGHVAVSLKTLSRKRKRPVAVLTVSDTGRGMSHDFVESSLFRAFEQENALSPGAGLGMSVVAKLVRGLGGKIEVQSSKDSGTTVTVAVPFEPNSQAGATLSTRLIHNRLGLLEVDSDISEDEASSTGRRLQLASIENTLRQTGATLTSSKDASLNLIFEDDLPELVSEGSLRGHPEGAHLIVLCHSIISAFQMQNATPVIAGVGRIEYVAQPFGPDRLSTAILNCAQTTTRTSSTSSAQLASSALISPQVSPLYEGLVRLQDSIAEVRLKRRGSILRNLEADDSSSEPPSPQPILATEQRKLSLLLVDDNAINLRLLTAYADKNKHPRLTAMDGLEAVNVYKASAQALTGTVHDNLNDAKIRIPKPDVVFLDINMPIMDGFQAAQSIRAFEKEANVPPTILIALTCLGSEEAKAEAVSCGIDMFLTKPVRPKEMTRILQDVASEVEENRVKFHRQERE